jgi:hypothetical protein
MQSTIGLVLKEVSRGSLTAEAEVRFQVSSCGICGGQSRMSADFCTSGSVSLCHCNSTNVLCSSSSTRCSYQKEKPAKPGDLTKTNAISEIVAQILSLFKLYGCTYISAARCVLWSRNSREF